MTTDFPTKGDDQKISLRNSQYPQFEYDFAADLKQNHAEIWKLGGNIRGNEAFNLWTKARDGSQTEGVLNWIKEREAWSARHFQDGAQFKAGDLTPNKSNVAGIVAQIKWGVIGTLGAPVMKSTITELIEKFEDRQMENLSTEHMAEDVEPAVEIIEAEQERAEPIEEKIEAEPVIMQRFYEANAKSVDPETRRVKLGVSSEEAVKRDFGMEVIDHSRENMNLEFLNSGRAPLLMDHDPSRQIGVVESVTLDEDARRLRAVARLGKGPLASEVFDDLSDGIRQNVSVGYRIDGRISREDDEDEIYRVRTTPMEISIVSIPADQSNLVGVGRSDATQLSKSKGTVEMTTENNIDIEAHTSAAIDKALNTQRKNDADILNLAATHNKRDMANEAISKGMKIEDFRGVLLNEIASKPLELASATVDLPKSEQREYNLSNMIRAQITNDYRDAGFEREMHDEITGRTGKKTDGFYVPDFAWGSRSGVMTTAATGAVNSENNSSAFIPTMHRGDLFIEALKSRMVLSDLGATYLPGLTNRISIPGFASGGVPAFVEEAGAVTDQSQTDKSVTLTPKTIGAKVAMSRLAMLESVPSIDQMVRNNLLSNMAVEIERAAINGAGSGGAPTGLLAASGVANLDISSDTDVADLTWADIVAMVKLVEGANGIENPSAAGWLTSPAVRAKMASIARVASTDSVMLLNDPWNNLYGYPIMFSSLIPTNLNPGDSGTDASAMIFGDFSQMLMGFFGAPSVLVDPYSEGDAGNVKIVVHQEYDTAVRHGPSFAKTDEIKVV